MLRIESLKQRRLRLMSVTFGRFIRNCTFLSDEFREGRPSTSVVAINVDAVREMIERDRHVTYREIQASWALT